MKKVALFLFALSTLFCLFALTTFAQDDPVAVTDTFYVVASQDSEAAIALKGEGKNVIVLAEVYASTAKGATDTWLDNFEEGSHVELIFAENVVESIGTDRGIVLNKRITLTVRYNGFSHYVTNNGRSNAFVMRHADASIRFIGTHAIDGEDGSISKDFKPNSANPSAGNVDITHGKVYCWVYDGDVYAYNMRTSTNEEFIFTTADDDVSNSKTNTITVHSCASTWIGISGDGDKKIIDFKDSYIRSHDFESLCTGSVIDNCVFGDNSFYMDSHSLLNEMLVIKNCKLSSIKSDTGRTNLTLIDCEFDINNLKLGSDGGGKGYALVYKTVTCENDGELNVYKYGSGTTPVNGKDVNEDSKFAQIVIDFYADPQNYAVGHNIEWSDSFADDKYLSEYSAVKGCTKCSKTVEEITLDAFFINLGYSASLDGNGGIAIGYIINVDAIARYEEITGKTLKYGVFVTLKDNIGDSPIFDEKEERAQGVISVEIDKKSFGAFELKLVGFTGEQKDVKLAMGAYVAETKEEITEYSYIQGEAPNENEKYHFVSYNDIINKAK